jgi:hypothetical protein
MAKDSVLEAIKQKKLQEMQQSLALQNQEKEQTNTCRNCGFVVEPKLQTELKPGQKFCPSCVIKLAKAFVISKAFMLQFGGNKKRMFAKIQEYDQDTNKFVDTKVIDMSKTPIVSVVGTIEFFKAAPVKPHTGKITVKRKGAAKQIGT